MSAEISLVWFTMSKALVRSIAVVDVQSGGQGRLMHWPILCATGSRTDTVEWLGRKPCWLSERRRELSSGCRRLNMTLTAEQRREITSTQISWFAGFGNRSIEKLPHAAGLSESERSVCSCVPPRSRAIKESVARTYKRTSHMRVSRWREHCIMVDREVEIVSEVLKRG